MFLVVRVWKVEKIRGWCLCGGILWMLISVVVVGVEVMV